MFKNEKVIKKMQKVCIFFAHPLEYGDNKVWNFGH